jgi:CBS domain containing-hemolysin-like protein
MNIVLVIILTLLFSAFFSGMEIAFVAANKLRLELDKKQGLISSRILTVFSNYPGKYITTMLVGNNVALVIYGMFMAKLLQPLILTFTSSPFLILLIQTIISTLFILFTAEFLPKTLVRLNPNSTLKFFSFPVFIFFVLFFPITQFVNWLSSVIMKYIFKSKTSYNPKDITFGKIDLSFLIAEAEESAETETSENDIKLFQNALDFSSVKLRDCMIPRPEIVAMEINSSIEDLRQKFIESGFSKILIYEESIDNLVGYITSKELFKDPKDIKSRLIAVSYFPETMPANKLLKRFIQEHKSLAVVVDEFGGIAGMLTIEDIIEEIFGEIEDEHDTIDFIEKQINDTEYLFSGRLEIDYLNEKYKLQLPESDEYDTIAGLIFFHNESIPVTNDQIIIDNFEIKILKVSKTRIELVQLKKHCKNS